MDKKLFSLYIILSLVLSCCRPAGNVKESWNSFTLLYFDTVCEITISCRKSQLEACQQEVRRKFSEVEESFSPESTDFSSPIVLDLFEVARNVSTASEGAFDITVAPLTRIWGFLDRNFRIPEQTEIQARLEHIGMSAITHDEEGLHLLPGMELDWGGIAKGFGVDLAARALIKLGVSRGFVNAGGDLFCWGKNPDDDSWRVGLKHPRRSGFLGVLFLSDLAAATTGDYQRYFERGGVRFHHVLDPHTGYPAQGKTSVTVIGPEAVVCDALSTALFVSRTPEIVIKKFSGYGAVIVDSEGNVFTLGSPISFERL